MTIKTAGNYLFTLIIVFILVACNQVPVSDQYEEIPSIEEIPSTEISNQDTQTMIEDEGEKIEEDEILEENVVTVIIVYDNYPYLEGLETDWGFAAWITDGDDNLLFDTGAKGNILLRNLEKLDIDPRSIQNIVLSHEHGDHVGGLHALISAGAEPVVYIPPSFSASFKERYQDRVELIEVSPGLEIIDGVYTLGEIAGPPPEQSLVIDTDQGQIVITGCAHPGIVKIVEKASEDYGKEIKLVMGGFHLGEKSRDKMDQIIEEFQQIGVEYVAPSHCTGEQQISQFRDVYGESFLGIGVGKEIRLDF